MSRYDDLDVDVLRRRGSVQWSACADDMLAAWVAEMDYPVAARARRPDRQVT